MKVIGPTTIAKLIEAHIDDDDEKFFSYANFIADAYEEQGEDNAAKIIRKRISGEYKTAPVVVLDKSDNNCCANCCHTSGYTGYDDFYCDTKHTWIRSENYKCDKFKSKKSGGAGYDR